ncbi:PadR family transcriptional regulator [Rhodococcus opacus]|uniref:PadR family transcriptional regulator n=1 Tax=Rhodococcus opacus TaxID=37919 RepID=UPI001C4841C7|nr:PadR family transcriptional regulator [Rhodococcus opacus]MBV6759067.1 PadR family transcriptional regulator [Rhodococcus opacus]
MSLTFAILTALSEQTSTGVELTRRFDLSIGYFWTATHQQIYRELAKLERDGLIEQVAHAPGRGQPKAFEITTEGVEQLRAWVTEKADPRPPREALLVRLRAAAALKVDGLEIELRRHQRLHEDMLETYRTIYERSFELPTDSTSQVLQRLVLEAGIALEQAWAQWCAAAVEELDCSTTPNRED